jgi:hypothetical protein
MKSIEDKAMNVMTELILGTADKRLFPRDFELIATWSILKVVVAEYDAQSQVKIHHTHRTYLMIHKKPPIRGWAVWIGHYERNNWTPEWVSHPMLLVPKHLADKRSHYKATYFNANSTTQVVGKLFIHVIHGPMALPIERWRFGIPHRGALFRIWPPIQTSIKWPAGALDDRAADVITDAFFRFIARKQADWFASLR